MEERAVKNIVVPFLKEMEWRYRLNYAMHYTVHVMVYCQLKFRAQCVYNDFRFDHLSLLWEREKIDYYCELKVAKGRKHQTQAKALLAID